MDSTNILPHGSQSALITGGGHTFLVVSKHDVEGCDVKAIMSFAYRWLESTESLMQAAGTISLTVDGYNEDPRDLSNIPEVAAFFAHLAQVFPQLPLFLTQNHPEILLYLSLAAGGTRSAYTPGNTEAVQGFHMHWDSKSKVEALCRAYEESMAQRMKELRIPFDHPLVGTAVGTATLLQDVLKVMLTRPMVN
ncbi:chlororespiratory reduction 6 domain-containing protein (plasmid) [Xanthomonas citri pv. citri]|uniref:chlororespiratory reduction 6 domain-containing protein n=1 Tax=Xanthomonas citri TaxID=346 RepID=UPI00193131CF|nr:chlororespiratory reduction 6 domain-containing protein [Xanthomonas citri]QRD62772.1 chlororespiratory reduction 6 domain-containing protein [Xanthomonas citri pv. citri]QRD67099.1 chlororespiratory reduction 6 domain-containing protein [Xanthomonas citri pv. citri]QRD71648.1 chlororespiratory reduction 6 domain-containing protein [Xanthomonas citri pv. citri]